MHIALVSTVHIHPEVSAALDSFALPDNLGFGRVFAPVMYRIDYQDGTWGEGALLPYAPIALDPASKILHFAQVAFEGLKAYRGEHECPVLFRPHMNARRMNQSAIRLQMPELPEEIFVEALATVTAWCDPLIPAPTGHSLYLRPFMFGTQADLGIEASDRYSFMIIASPSAAVMGGGPIRVLVDAAGTRAMPGGTGHIKASGNYGAALVSSARAKDQGFFQPLWLDAAEHSYIEELSAMNFFAVIDGELHTPELTGTILPGITRDSLVTLARSSGITVHEGKIHIDDLMAGISSGRCSEAFGCGTAAVVLPISAIGYDGSLHELQDTEFTVARQLRRDLLDIQEGRAPDRFGWVYKVDTNTQA
jgi:branched-chain amino acid aminotransferase